MPDLAFSSVRELAVALRQRRLGSLELLDHYLERVEEVNARINAIVTLDPERARAEARAADERFARGDPMGPLHGIPMTIKDSIETEGMRTTAGAEELRDHVPQTDAPAVARLRSAGAIVFGKTNLPAYAGDFQTFNQLFGTTNNPWRLDRSPGGSSGGAAAVVCAGLAALELGSDIAGSIRNPAHCCGIYGHKPSFGIVPTMGHIPGPPGSMVELDLNVIGPLARSVDDLEVALGVMADPLRQGAVSLPQARHMSASDYRVAAWLDDPACPLDAEVGETLAAAVAALRRSGVAVNEDARPRFSLQKSHRTFLQLHRSQLSMSYSDEEFARLQERVAGADDRPITEFARDATMTHRDWMTANEERASLRSLWDEFFRDYDVLLCPIAPVCALPHAHDDPRYLNVNGERRPYWDLKVWPALASVSYLPATVVPVGRGRGDLPVGLQIIGPYLEDRTTLDVARCIGEVVGGFQPPPGLSRAGYG